MLLGEISFVNVPGQTRFQCWAALRLPRRAGGAGAVARPRGGAVGRTLPNVNVGYFSTSPEVRLSGEMAELYAKLFNAMAAEGVACRGQGDTLQFLLETLGENLRRGF